MKGGNKMNFGLGFGTAMFVMKDIQDMYGQFDPKTQQIPKPTQKKILAQNVTKPKPIQVKNNTKISVKESQKPKLILKTTTNTNPKPNVNITKKTTQLNNTVKKVPVIDKAQPQVKQPQKIIKSQQKVQQLNSLQVGKQVFQLTINPKPTRWKYFELNDPNSKHASLIVPNPQISFSFNHRNIKQGSIGNCYFICSLAALAENIQHLKERIIPNYEKYTQKSQSFIVYIFQSGKLVEMKVLNSFNHSYSKPIGNDITTLILQKAYAQLYGGYEIMNMGHSIDAFRDLSGTVAEYIDLKNKQTMKNQVIHAFQSHHPMVIASKQSPNSQFISAKHSYNILSYSESNNQFYIELRDPRGWTKANFNLPQNLKSNIENGQFWVPYKDLVQNFEVITVSRFMKNSFYYFKTFGSKDLTLTGLSSLSFRVNQKLNISASVHQKHKKFFDQKYKYNVVNIMICEIDDKMNITRTIKTNFNSNQVCSLSQTLQKGTYVIVGQIYPFKNNNKQYKFPDEIFTISLNTDNQVKDFHMLPQFNLAKALTLYIRQNPDEFKQLITKQNLQRQHGSLFGKVCIFYDNQSDKNVIQELQFDVQNVEIKQKKVMLAKGQKKLIMCPIGPINNCSHKCSFKSKTFYSK